MKEQQHIFTNKMLRTLLIPVIFEQVLNSLMGTVDTMMVSNVGSAAISAVSLVDSINVLVIQAFSALAAGGAILCSQYIGQHICSSDCSVPAVSCAAVKTDIRKSRSRCYDCLSGVFLLYGIILSIYSTL